MQKYSLIVEVDEKKLKSNKNEKEEEQTLEELIINEMGWVEQSGIYLMLINKIE